VIHDRPNPPSKVVLIDPYAEQLAATSASVFGTPPTPMALGAKEVDWQRTLGR